MGSKLGRNEKCHCGSGKKYKKCCLDKDNILSHIPLEVLESVPVPDKPKVGLKKINSEAIEIDGKPMVFSASPHMILESIYETLHSIGPKAFFSNPDEETKKLRESMAAMFMALAIKKNSGQDWWITQPDKDPPDFVLTSYGEGSPGSVSIAMALFELVEIQERCNSFEEAIKIVEGKLKKGYPENYNLLVFVNHIESVNWIERLYRELPQVVPFQSLWTLHLLQDPRTGELSVAIANKLRPDPVFHSEFKFNEPDAFKFNPLPSYMKAESRDGKTFMTFDEKFAQQLRKEMMKALQARRQTDRKAE